jgi:hypothetical protein
MESWRKRAIDLFSRSLQMVVSKRNSAQLSLHKLRESQEGGGDLALSGGGKCFTFQYPL